MISERDLNQFQNEQEQIKSKTTFSPLIISGGESNTQDYWAIDFQSLPVKKIVITGKPTREQIFDALSTSYMPAIFVSLLDIIVEVMNRDS